MFGQTSYPTISDILIFIICLSSLGLQKLLLENDFKAHRYDVVHVNQPHGYLAAKALRTLDPRAIFVHRSHGLEARVKRELARWKNEIWSG